MTISLKHLFQSAVPDDGDANLVQPSNWNAEHVLTLGTGKLVGRSTVGTGAAEEISIGSGLSISGGVLSLTGTISSLTTPVISGGTTASSTLTLQSTSGAGTTDALLFKTGSQVERMRIDSAGKVGIGGPSPFEFLYVKPSAASGSFFYVDSYDTGSGGSNINAYVGVVNYNNDGYGDGFSVQYARGTSSSRLAVQANDILGYFYSGGWDGTAYRGRGEIYYQVDGAVSALTVPTAIVFRNGSTGLSERMRITSSGKVGIGTSAPNSLLSVVGNLTSGAPSYTNNIQLIAAADEYPQFEVRNYGSTDDAGGFMIYTAGGSPSSQSSRWPSYPYNGYLTWQTYNASNTGNIGTLAAIDSIQTGAPTATGNVGALRFFTSDGTIQYGGIERMRIASDGFVGIGTSAPNYPESIFNVRYPVGTSVFGLDRYDSGSGGGNINIWAYVENYNNDGYGEGFYGQYARGTRSSPLAVQPGDELAYFGAGGYDGTGYRWSSQIYYRVDGAVSVGTVPIAMLFKTGTSGGGSVERMRITSTGNVGIGTSSPTQMLTVNGGVGYNAPVTITGATYVVTATDNWLIANYAGTVTLTLPAASSYTGRIINVKTVQAQTVVSNSSDVVPIGSTSAGTAILSATAGAFAKLVSDGTNWVVNEASQGSGSSTLTVGTTATSGGAAGQIMFDTGSVLQESSNLVWDNTNKKLTITGATVTTSQPVLDMTQTWNAAGVTFTGLKFNATDTASASSSLLMDLQVGGITKFNVKKDGSITLNVSDPSTHTISTSNAGYLTFARGNTAGVAMYESDGRVQIASGGFFGWTSSSTVAGQSADLLLTRRGAANLRFGAADAAAPVAQTLSVQSVVAGTSNTAGANLTITGSQGTGTGAGGSIIFQVAPAGSSGTAQNALTSTFTLNSDFTTAGGIASFTSNFTSFGGVFLRNTNNTGGSPSTGFTAQNDTTSQLLTRVYGSSVTGVSVWGITLANYSGVFSTGAASNGLLVGTLTATPLIFGTNTAEAFRVTSTQQIQIGSSNQFGWSTDLILTRRGAANLRFGAADAAAPVAQTLSVQSVVAGTSNTAGANLTITGSQGTGTGAGGSIIFQTAPAGSSGTAQNALTTALTIASNGQVYRGSPTTATLNSGIGFVVQGSRTALPSLYQIASEDTGASDAFGGGVFTVISNDGAAVASGDRLGGFFFAGSSSASAVRYAAGLFGFANQTWVDGSAYGSRFEFATTANGSTTRTTRLIIGNSGIITFGATEANTAPALKPSSTILQVRLADDSAYAPVEASTVRTATAYTVATLPAAGTAGRRAYVTDATAPTWLGALTGGGTVVCPVFDNGVQWVAG